jgi:hypothetical protein
MPEDVRFCPGCSGMIEAGGESTCNCPELEDALPPLKRKLMSTCPFCGAKQTMDKLHTRFYACGTTADRDRGVYNRRCGK